MARRKKAQIQNYRNANTMISRNVSPRRTSGVSDWVVGAVSLDSTGLPVPAGMPGPQPTWGGFVSLASSGVTTFQAISIQPTPMSSTPTLGRLRIDEVVGKIWFDSESVLLPAGFQAVVCIYVADLNNTTSLWNVRNPLTPQDASRDDYLFLESIQFVSTCNPPLITGTSAFGVFGSPCIDLSISQPVVIGGGQALHITVAAVSTIDKVGATVACGVSSFFRTRIGPVA